LGSGERRQVKQHIETSEALRRLLSQRDAAIGFYERLYGSVDTRFYCPWLKNGLYLAAGGEVVPCCYVKDYRGHALARLEQGLDGFEQRRAALQQALHRGRVPAACTGCRLAQGIVQNVLRLGEQRGRGPW